MPLGPLTIDDACLLGVHRRSSAANTHVRAQVPARGRDTMGVVFARFEDDDAVLGLAKNSERALVPDTSNIPVITEKAGE